MAERACLGETRGRAFDACGAPGPRTPGRELLRERLLLFVAESEQHDADVVQPQRSLGEARGLLLEWQLEPESAPLADGALHPDLPAHHLDELLGDRGAEPGAAVPPGGGIVGLDEALEDALLDVLRNADARILDREAQPHRVVAFAQTRHGQRHPTRLGELDAVA